MANISEDARYVIVVALRMMIAYNRGRHPFAGFAAALAGVSGAVAAKLITTASDAVLVPIAAEAARVVEPPYAVNAASNCGFVIWTAQLFAFVIFDIPLDPRRKTFRAHSA